MRSSANSFLLLRGERVGVSCSSSPCPSSRSAPLSPTPRVHSHQLLVVRVQYLTRKRALANEVEGERTGTGGEQERSREDEARGKHQRRGGHSLSLSPPAAQLHSRLLLLLLQRLDLRSNL